MESVLMRFAEMCKSDKSKLVVRDYVSSNAEAIGEGHASTKLRVYKLLDGLKWPMFLLVSQMGVECENLYFCRMTPADIARRELTLQLLMQGKSPIWIGIPGIGKSADMNYILMELLTHIGEVDWPAVVAFRFDGLIAEFRYDSSMSVTTISWHQGHYADILRYTERVREMGETVALVLELGETEMDPLSWLPMTIAIPSSNADNVLKTLRKIDTFVEMLVSPPTVEEMQLMVEAELDLNQKSSFSPTLSIDQAKAEVKRRADIVGPIPRYVISSDSGFIYRKKTLNRNFANSDSNFFSWLSDLKYGNIPDRIDLCIAPFLKYGVVNPQLYLDYGNAVSQKIGNILSPSELRTAIYEFKFLSDYLALNVANKATDNNKDIAMLKLFDLDYLLAGVVIKYIVLDASMRPEVSSEFWDMSHWEWHVDPGYHSLLDKTTRITSTSIPAIPPCFREITFSGVYLNKPAKELEAGVLYRSISPNMAVEEFLTVDHATKTVFIFQASFSDIKERPFTASAIDSVMTGLNMISTTDRKSAQYSLHLLFFADWSLKKTHGSKIIDDLSSESTLNFSQIKSNIIRACICPEREKYVLKNVADPPISDRNQGLTDPRIYWREGNPQAIDSQSTQRTQAIDPQTTRRTQVTKRASLKKKKSTE